jgi:hypothetical protein
MMWPANVDANEHRYKWSELYDEPTVTAPVEKIAAAEHTKVAA